MALTARSGALAGSPVTVSLPDSKGRVTVLNRDATAVLWFTLNGQVPTAGGDDCVPVLPQVGVEVTAEADDAVVTLFSAGTPAYTVLGEF